MKLTPLALIAAAAVAAAVVGAIVGSGALAPGAGAPPSVTLVAEPTPSPAPSGPMAHVYVVAEGKPPLRVESTYPLMTGALLTRVASRIDGLRSTVAPEGYVNPYNTSTVRLERVTNDEPNVITLWFRVANDDWGVPPERAKLLLQQLVWTATEEPGIVLIRILQNEGREGGANVAGVPANYEMTRKDFP
ncbi:MAG TPA: hypothetical protein VNB06_04385 [Thermoanaerobaculia bacterium]|nr:hypothetical protein [Thermoanaerobaculia bacterium]